VTGVLVDDSTPQAFADGIEALDRTFDATVIRRHAERFSRARFRRRDVRDDRGAGAW
jgi:hypothetical protein